VAALDNPKTIDDLKVTAANAKTLTARWDAVGGDVRKLPSDPTFMDGVRSVAVGLGKFFDELYPPRPPNPGIRPPRTRPPVKRHPKPARPLTPEAGRWNSRGDRGLVLPEGRGPIRPSSGQALIGPGVTAPILPAWRSQRSPGRSP
jgi:hypothetical protein